MNTHHARYVSYDLTSGLVARLTSIGTALLLGTTAALAQVPTVAPVASVALSPQANIAQTIGSQEAVRSGLKFCTLDNAAPLAQAAAELSATGQKVVLTSWTIAQTPGRIGKVVAISNVSQAACRPLQALPAGGVEAMQLEVPYAVIDKAPDWSVGYTALVMAIRDNVSAADYGPRLKRHVNLVSALFESKGLDGYVVYAGVDHEWAYLHWPDEDTAKRAFATPDGATGPKDSRSFQRPVVSTPISGLIR